jgi:hypothetical protein
MKLLMIIGPIITVMGLIWMGQGAGYIQWPRSSFMLFQTQWVYYGAATVALGVVQTCYAFFKKK